MKKLTAIILSILMVTTFTSCGGVSEDADKYIAYSVSMFGVDIKPSEVYDDDIVLALDEKGKAMLTLDGEKYNCKWKMKDDVFTLSQGSDEFTGTKEGDIVTILNVLNMDLDISFLKEGAPLPVDKSKPTGKYILSGMDMSGIKMSYVDIQNSEMNMNLEFKEDGTVEMSSNGEVIELPIDYDDKTIDIDGAISDFVFEDEQFIMSSEVEGTTMQMIFTAEDSGKWEEIEAEGSAIMEGFPDGGESSVESSLGTDTSKPTGKYLISGTDMSGMKMSYADIQTAKMDMNLEFKEDGTVEMSSYGEVLELQIDYDGKTIDIDGEVSDFVFEDEQFTIISEIEGATMQMIFTAENSEKWIELKAEGSTIVNEFVAPGYGAEKTISTETLSVPSGWYGIVTITDYQGPYAEDTEGEHEARAVLSNYDGKDYFELYVDGIYEDSNVILSYYTEVYDYTFYPIADENSWIFDINLTEDDESLYIPTLINGVLSARYEYVDDDESFTFTYELAMTEEPYSVDLAIVPKNEPEVVGLSKEKLKEAYATIDDLSLKDLIELTYEEVVANYMYGVEGEINEYDNYIIYIWKSEEAETSYVKLTFKLKEEGVWELSNHSAVELN